MSQKPTSPRPAARTGREPQRIAKLLARAGVASRREIERMIEARRIAIDGVPIETPATLLTSLHGVTVDAKPVQAPAPARLFLFHKPAGVLTTERDPKGRPTIYDRLPRDLPRVVPVGRLDLNTEGLLLLTTDGELKRQLELPATGVERSYRARAFGTVTQAQLEALIDGIEIEGVRYGSIDANIERRTGANVWVEMRLREGKNREVRRVLEHLGLKVSRLIRTAYGPFVLGDLPAGEVGEVRQVDLINFRKTLEPAPKSLSPLAGASGSAKVRNAPGIPKIVPGARSALADPDARLERGDARKRDDRPRPGGPGGRPAPPGRSPLPNPPPQGGREQEVRIISGAWRGRVLKAPSGDATRPTADRTREALFSMLASRLGSFEDLTVADIFAGTGALGLEALSRGAGFCTFVDHDRDAIKAIRANIDMLGAKGEVLAVPVSALGPPRRAHDLLLFDPPYGSGGAGALLEKLTRLGWAADSAWAAVETRSDEQVSADGWTVDAERRHGIAKLSVLCRKAPEQSD